IFAAIRNRKGTRGRRRSYAGIRFLVVGKSYLYEIGLMESIIWERRNNVPIINIRGRQVDVDIEAELREYPWERERWTADKLIACSPFRHDSHPSFFVNLETGGWADSGAHADTTPGTSPSFLGYLRGTDWTEASDYLIDKYGVLYDLTDDSEGVHIPTPKLTYSTTKLKEIRGENVVQAVSPYVSKRGISPEVQREF